MAYVVGISSGIFGAAPQQEKMQYLGISNKVNYCITQGVTFTQIDIETMSEFKDPKISIDDEKKREAWKEKIKDMNIEMGFHGESQAMGGRETPVKLDSAIEDDYIRTHDRLTEVLDNAGKLGAKYYLLHSSESIPFILLGKDFQPSILVDFWGRPLNEFILSQKDSDGKEWLMDWIVKQNFIWKEWWGKVPESLAKERVKAEEEHTAIRYPEHQIPEDTEGRLKTYYEERYREDFLENIRSRSLRYGPERFAYWIIAKWMETKKDGAGHELWKKITSEWDKKKVEINKPDSRASMDDDVFRESPEGIAIWVPAVAAMYLWGHFNQDKCPGKTPVKDKRDPKKILEKYKMYFIIETPMAQAGMENLMRLSDPVHMCKLAEEMNFKYFRVAIDFEHVLSNYINPIEMIKRMGETHGNLIKVLHLGWPTPVIPAHMPIYVGSEQHKWIYERLWELRQKGFTPDEDRYLIYERGSARIEQSILAMRLIVEFLNDNVKSEDLPLKFFGVEGASPAVIERQRVIIREHARDPLESLLVVPEEKYTALGKAGAEKAGAEKWKKEELS